MNGVLQGIEEELEVNDAMNDHKEIDMLKESLELIDVPNI